MHITPIPSYRSLPEALYPIAIVFDCDISIPRVCVHRGYHLAESVTYCAYLYYVTEGNDRGCIPLGSNR